MSDDLPAVSSTGLFGPLLQPHQWPKYGPEIMEIHKIDEEKDCETGTSTSGKVNIALIHGQQRMAVNFDAVSAKVIHERLGEAIQIVSNDAGQRQSPAQSQKPTENQTT